MLARLKSVVLTLDGTRSYAEDEEMKSVPEDEAMVMDVQYLRRLMPVPDTAAWWRVAGMCGQAISPVYRGIQGILMEDIDRVAEVLSQVGYDCDEEDDVHEGRCTEPSLAASPLLVDPSHLKPPAESDKFPDKPRRKRRRSTNTDRCLPLVIPSTHPSAPTIIVTPCPPEPLMTDGHVPYQDRAHGLKLTVPAHPAFNATFPPMAPSPYMLPLVSKWKWQDGHWQALLPDLEEQAKKGMYSRAVTVKNRPCRRPLRSTNSN